MEKTTLYRSGKIILVGLGILFLSIIFVLTGIVLTSRIEQSVYQNLVWGTLFFAQMLGGFILLRNFDLSGRKSMLISAAITICGWLMAGPIILAASGIQC